MSLKTSKDLLSGVWPTIPVRSSNPAKPFDLVQPYSIGTADFVKIILPYPTD